MGVLALSAAVMVVPFPETAKKPLPNTKEDVRNLSLNKPEMNSREVNDNLIA